MKRGLLIGQAVAIATIVLSGGSVSAQGFSSTQQAYAARCTYDGRCSMRSEDDGQQLASLTAAPSFDLSPRTHDDWMLAAPFAAPSLDLSPRTRDDWMVAAPFVAPSLDLSLRSHDDWPLRSAE